LERHFVGERGRRARRGRGISIEDAVTAWGRGV
jgi:hypothetical protein